MIGLRGGVRRLKHGVVFCTLSGLALLAGNPTVDAAPPQYWLLRAPAEVNRHHQQRGYYPAQLNYMSRHAYAYGWFGVPPRQHWVRHEGYRHQYVQWRKR